MEAGKRRLHGRAGRLFLILALVLTLSVLTACGAKPQEQPGTTVPELQSVTEPETLPPVQITMPDYELAYSGELKDVILVEKLEDESGLKFAVQLSGSQAHIFTLHYNNDQGDLVTFFEDAEGNRVPVAFEMAAIPEGLADEDLKTFCLAQEAVNEIVGSLTLK